jgi:flagellar biosynthesis protein
VKKTGEKGKQAVALHYDGQDAPRLTAKGQGPLAEEIIALAREHGIPLQEDRELTALLAQLDLGEAIPRELYLAVAEVLAFAFFVTGRVPADAGEPRKGDKETS